MNNTQVLFPVPKGTDMRLVFDSVEAMNEWVQFLTQAGGWKASISGSTYTYEHHDIVMKTVGTVVVLCSHKEGEGHDTEY